jgi:hypothetical protein
MDNFVVKAVVLLVLPTLVIIGGAYFLSKLSGQERAKPLICVRMRCDDRTGLGLRIFGYDLDAVSRHWGALDLDTERRALEIDLIFPFLYGGALATALLLAWAALDRPFHPVWLILPIAITVVADWAENLVQLSQLRLFNSIRKVGLQFGWIRIASAATTTKLVFYSCSSLLLIGLVAWIVVRGVARRS